MGQLSVILINHPVERLNPETSIPNTNQWSHNDRKIGSVIGLSTESGVV